MKRVNIYISMGSIGLALLTGLIGWYTHNFYMLGVTTFLLFFNNVFYAFQVIRERILFLLFQIIFFTFLLARPILGTLHQTEWYSAAEQAEENVRFALLIVILALLGMYVGANLANRIHAILESREAKESPTISKTINEKMKNWNRNLSLIALIMFYTTIPFFFGQELEKLIFMRGREYIDYYSQFQSRLPSLFFTISSFMKYSLCLFLATFPTRRRAVLPLILLGISAIPALLIGERNPIVLNAVFIFVYFCIRELLENKGKWVGKIEKRLAIISVPIASIALSIYGNLRGGGDILKEKNPFILLEKFFLEQGVSFDILSIAYGYRFNLPQREEINYTFGAIIDYFQYGRIGQWLLGTTPMPDGNNIIRATQGNSLSHHLAYVTRKESYFEGMGYGSSYILEAWLDYGYIGVFIVNILLGMLLIYALYWFQKNNLVRTIILVSLLTIFLIPRAETSSWIMFLFTIQFWLCVGACYLGTLICVKSKLLQSILTKLHLYPKKV